jgi:hypothetical protein
MKTAELRRELQQMRALLVTLIQCIERVVAMLKEVEDGDD